MSVIVVLHISSVAIEYLLTEVYKFVSVNRQGLIQLENACQVHWQKNECLVSPDFFGEFENIEFKVSSIFQNFLMLF